MDNELPIVPRYNDVLQRLGDREPSTVAEAQAVLENIRIEKGYLDEDILRELSGTSQRTQDSILYMIAEKKATEAAYTRSISTQLYSSKYRFLYELIQNADDSSFSRAQSHGNLRRLIFEITPETFTIKTNEDGFTRANVEAICATGKSSKNASASDNHIGEKGFGFKSVFSVADEVHIRSRVWSFSFKHRSGDDGLGMVTPLDAPCTELPQSVTTQITLKLSNTARREYQRLLDAVAEMPDTTIFFLQKLQSIEIRTTNNGELEETVIQKSKNRTTGIVTITRSHKVRGTNEDEVNDYHVFTHTIENMPTDERRRGRKRVKLDLAFPIHAVTKQPKLSALGQHVFAYLPLQRLPQIQFLIQSDFITSASRESVIDCAWNDGIRVGVAKLFTIAISKFATANHPLRYSWLDYLPVQPMEHLWRPLYPSIKDILSVMPVLQTWERRQFTRPSKLCRVTPIALHNGKPILKDTIDECYIAPEYARKHEDTLKDLGVVDINWSHILDRLQADLVSSVSDVKTRSHSDSWHEAFAILFSSAFRDGVSTNIKWRIKNLSLIPLEGGTRWAGAPDIRGRDSIYFPYTNTIPIPGDISLNLVERTAALNPLRKAFYIHLGVKDCPKETVFAKIEEAHRSPRLFQPLDTTAHLRYLFHFHSQPELLKFWIRIPTEEGVTTTVSNKLYFPSNEEYDMQQLLPEQYRSGLSGIVEFISRSLVDLEPFSVRPQGFTWKGWLSKVTNARYYPFFTQSSGNPPVYSLSPHLLVILQYNPGEFLGTLKAHWDKYQYLVDRVRSELKECKVPCVSGTYLPLQSTYIPTLEIRSKISELQLSENEFPLLKLPGPVLDETNYRQWQFLEDFDVRLKLDIEFYKLALKKMAEADVSRTSGEKVKEVYKCMACLTSLQEQEELSRFFNSFNSIWYSDPTHSAWLNPAQCIWKGPDFLTTKTVLVNCYRDDEHIKKLFRMIIGIRDSNLDDIFESLQHMREHCHTREEFRRPSYAQTIYRFLDTTYRTSDEQLKIREAFRDRPLVLGEAGRWYKLQSCLWKSPFSLADYQDLSAIYTDLENFFVNRLNVKAANPAMLIKEVRRMAREQEPRINDIRYRLIEIGMMLAKIRIDTNMVNALERLKEVDFLPKRDSEGTLKLVGINDDFAIVDHPRYAAALAEHPILLDFDVNESQILHTMFQHLGLTFRYLSNSVKEMSSVGEDVRENETLEQELRAKAYAFYCCAARYKSVLALRGERELFDQLSQIRVYTTNEISTHLILQFSSGPVRVQSDRICIHHEISNGQLKLYVPDNQQQRRSCYRSQLPKLLADITHVRSIATHSISQIISCDLRDLDLILSEQDIPSVDWIDRPILEIPELEEDEPPNTPAQTGHASIPPSRDADVFSTPSETRILTPPSPTAYSESSTLVAETTRISSPTPAPRPAQYHRLVEQVIQSAQRSSYRQRRSSATVAPVRDTTPVHTAEVYVFDHHATFGNRDRNEMAHDRRIGAAGEAYVFELLAGLGMPDFTRANWRSTIRGELQAHSRYAQMDNWVGRETADIVYVDRDGTLTQYLRDHCTGGFPGQVAATHDFRAHPIEYYLEVKTTVGGCATRFFMSNAQYQRMQNSALGIFERPDKIYAILRVYNLTSTNVGLKIFVDPWRFNGNLLQFEAGYWTGTAM